MQSLFNGPRLPLPAGAGMTECHSLAHSLGTSLQANGQLRTGLSITPLAGYLSPEAGV